MASNDKTGRCKTLMRPRTAGVFSLSQTAAKAGRESQWKTGLRAGFHCNCRQSQLAKAGETSLY